MDLNSPKRFRIEKHFWYWWMIPAWTLLYLFVRPVFDETWALAVVVVTLYTAGLSADGAENAAEAREEARDTED